MQIITDNTATTPPQGDDCFDDFVAAMRRHAESTKGRPAPLFTTVPADPLDEVYLTSLSPEIRQVHDCRACRHFIRKYGSVVTIDQDTGATKSVFWGRTDSVPPAYRDAVSRMRRYVERAPVTGVFLSSEAEWGTEENQSSTGKVWTHLSCAHLAKPFRHPLKSEGQVMAEKREERDMLARGLTDFSRHVVEQAVSLLQTEALYRSEKCLGVATWLLRLHEKLAGVPDSKHRVNITWLAAAEAPAGFCHVRSSTVGTLLEDIAAGLSLDTVQARFAEKMHPLKYMRPTSAPSEDNVAEAERVVAMLNSVGALARRFATLSDLHPLWAPKQEKLGGPAAPVRGGVFGHMRTKDVQTREFRTGAGRPGLVAPPTVVTWEKFRRVALASAERVEFLVPGGRASYLTFVTAANPEAPPLLQWDREGARNPVSWYLYVNGSLSTDFGLQPGEWRDVSTVTLSPAKWGDGGDGSPTSPSPNQADMAVFVLRGARDAKYVKGAGLFPEILRSEYHAVRKTVEAHSREAVVEGKDGDMACGVALIRGPREWDYLFRVTSRDRLQVTFRIDRWD